MYNRILAFLEKSLLEFYPSMAAREGTGIYDLFIKIFALIANRLLSILDSIKRDNDPRNYATMSELALDRYGRQWFLTRNDGSYASGRAKIYLRKPTRVALSSGFTVLSADGLEFETRSDYVFGSDEIAASKDGNYYTFEITVYAKAFGEQYNIDAHMITDISSSTNFDWVRIDNDSAFTNGVGRESNTEFYQRIISSVNSRDLLITKGSVETSIMANFPTVGDVYVVGYGDVEMERDIVYSILMPGGFNPYSKSDFYGKQSGQTTYNRSIAYKYASTTQTPAISEFENELYDADYRAISINDLNFMSHRGGLILYEEFDDNNLESRDWIRSDSGLPFGTTHYGTSIRVENSELLLGAEAPTYAPIGGI